MDETRSGRARQVTRGSSTRHATRKSAISGRLAENSQEAAWGVRLVVVPVSLRLWSMFEEVDCMSQTALAALVHADCDVQADGRQQHRRLGTP